MTAVSVMPESEQRLQEEDPDLLRAAQMTGSIRWLELYRSYLLADRLEREPRDRHGEIINHWAHTMGMTTATLASHLGWARAINLDLLNDTFEGEGISEKEWTQRIGTSHLKEIAKAKNQTTNEVLTPGRMVDLVIETYHANWSVAELLEVLRKRNLRAPARGMKNAPSKLPGTMGALLRRMADSLEGTKDDIDILGAMERRERNHPGKPVNYHVVLEWAMAEMKRERGEAAFTLLAAPQAEWAPKVEEKAAIEVTGREAKEL